MQTDPDVLAVEPRRRLPRQWLAALVVVALAAGLAAWAVDDHRRSEEAAALHACRAELAETVHGVSLRLGAMAEYWRPAWSALRGERAREVADHLRGPARSAANQLADARDHCKRVEVRPWHGATAERRRATLAYADAWLTRLDEVARHGDAWFRPDEHLSALGARAGLT